MTKTSQDNNLNYINFWKYFYQHHTEKLKYRDVICLILKVLTWWIFYYCFCSHIQSLVELQSVIVATAPYFDHTAPLTYSLGWCTISIFLVTKETVPPVTCYIILPNWVPIRKSISVGLDSISFFWTIHFRVILKFQVVFSKYSMYIVLWKFKNYLVKTQQITMSL